MKIRPCDCPPIKNSATAMRYLSSILLALVVLMALACTATPAEPTPAPTVTPAPTPDVFDWRSEWAVEAGFNINIEARGLRLPTAIAFVPNPGPAPKDPLFFVTELSGRVAVVTNDRTVSTFAENFYTGRIGTERPPIGREIGMAGICLAPEHGYVFVTFVYDDAQNIPRNNIVRFQTAPGTFSKSPTSLVDFTEIFDSHRSSVSHQIGPCSVTNDHLYVSVGDGHQIPQSQNLNSVLGKILRMTLDGRPAPENPFYKDDDNESAQDFVWAYGLRNPFGLDIQQGKVLVADNGVANDRFLLAKEGLNYLWDGSRESMGSNADVVFSSGGGVAQLDYYPSGSKLFPEKFEDNVFITRTGNSKFLKAAFPAIWTLPYDISQEKLTAVPKPFARYQGDQFQVLAALAFGPDGLYFAPLFPNRDGFNGIYKITYNPLADYPFTLENQLSPPILLQVYGCPACHSLKEDRGGAAGPPLGRDVLLPSITGRLNSSNYIAGVRELDELEQEPFRSFRNARQEILQLEGTEQVRRWVYYRLLEPRFDDQNAIMPKVGLSDAEAAAIAKYLTEVEEIKVEAIPTPEENPAEDDDSMFGRASDWVQAQFPIRNRANPRTYVATLSAVGLLVLLAASAFGFWLGVRRKANKSADR